MAPLRSFLSCMGGVLFVVLMAAWGLGGLHAQIDMSGIGTPIPDPPSPWTGSPTEWNTPMPNVPSTEPPTEWNTPTPNVPAPSTVTPTQWNAPTHTVANDGSHGSAVGSENPPTVPPETTTTETPGTTATAIPINTASDSHGTAGWRSLWKFDGDWNWDSSLATRSITAEIDSEGELALAPRRKVLFDPNLGFSASHDPSLLDKPCEHRFCLYLSFTSNYGAESDFDAFVMDRFESKGKLGSDQLREHGPVPFVNGAVTDAELNLLFNGNEAEIAASPLKHNRKTTWMLYPISDDDRTDEIDIVMSFKQLYTLLPDYDGVDAASNGPFYSADPNDQVILRLNVRLVNSFVASTMLLPVVLDFKGSNLFQVSYTSSILYHGDEQTHSNQLALDLEFSRDKFGWMAPWSPVKLSSECKECSAQLSDGDFTQCLSQLIGDATFERLLSPEPEATSVNIAAARDVCFNRLRMKGAPLAASTATDPLTSPPLSADQVAQAITEAETGLRCFVDSQCPFGSPSPLSDAKMVVLAGEDAVLRVTFSEPEFAFRLELSALYQAGIETEVIFSTSTGDEIAQAVQRAIPGGETLKIAARAFDDSNVVSDSLTIPAAVFTVEIVFSSMNVVPIVTAVTSPMSVAWTYTPAKLELVVTPFKLSKFSYVPPPANLDLDPTSTPSEDEPPTLFLPGPCNECLPQYTACAKDEDCRFGVRTYFFPALMSLVAQSASSSVEIASVFDMARRLQLVPSAGVSTLAAFVQCLATRSPKCDVDVPWTEVDPTTGVSQQSSPAYLRLVPSRIQVKIENGGTFTITAGSRSFEYQESGSPQALASFLQTNLAVGTFTPNIAVTIEAVPDTPLFSKYTIMFNDPLYETPSISVSSSSIIDGTNTVVRTPSRVFIETDGRSTGRSQAVHWQRLLIWLHPLSLDTAPSTGTGTGTGTSADTGSNSVILLPPGNLNAVCSVCMDALDACLQDPKCASVPRAFLRTALAPSNLLSSLMSQGEGPYEIPFGEALDAWTSETAAPWLGEGFLAVLNCLSKSRCAVGYNTVLTATSMSAPTTVEVGIRMAIVVQPLSTVEFLYKGETLSYHDTASSSDLERFLTSDLLKNGARVEVIKAVVDDFQTQYDIRIDQAVRALPLVLQSATTQVVFQESVAVLRSPMYTEPSWNSLLEWFGATDESPSPTPDVCAECLPSIAACINDAECFAILRDELVPHFRQARQNPSTTPDFSATFVRPNTIYSFDLTPVMTKMFLSSGTTMAPPYWSTLASALTCLERPSCELGYPTVSALPPATAYAPTNLRVTHAAVHVILLEGTPLVVTFMGGSHAFTHTRDIPEFKLWLLDTLGGLLDVQFVIANNNDKPNEYEYLVEFRNYFGELPEFVLPTTDDPLSPPRVLSGRPTKMWIESVNLVPDWQKLIDYFSLAATNGATGPVSTTSYACSECTAALNACFSDAACQYSLLAYVVPVLRQGGVLTTVGDTYEYDFAPAMVWNVLPTVPNPAMLLEVVKCVAASSCLDTSAAVGVPGSHAYLVFTHPTTTFRVPVGTEMTITYGRTTLLYEDRDDTLGLQRFLEDALFPGLGAQAQVSRAIETTGVATYDIVFVNLYTLTAPHFSWPSATADRPGESVEKPWRFAFSSTTGDVQAASKAWIEWLMTNGNTVVAARQ